MIINLFDPGLSFVGGHHLQWDRLLAEELAAQGHTVTVYCHKGIVPEARAAFRDPVALVPLFRNYAYVHPLQLDPVAGELLGFIDIAIALTEDLTAAAPADLWLWPSLMQAQLYACALARTDTPVSGCIHAEPGFMSSLGSACWRYAFLKANQAGLSLNLGVPSPILQQEYGALFGSPSLVKLLPLPIEGRPGGFPKTSLRTIGFFGHQRQEKGVELVPPLISKLLNDGYRVVLHDSAQAFGAEQIPGLTRIGYVDDLAAEIAKCDLLILPYPASAYRSKESAIVWDALASGVPILVPNGTASSLRVLTEGAGKVFHFHTVDSICNALEEARRDFPRIAAGAFGASQRWPETHGVARLADALVGSGRQ